MGLYQAVSLAAKQPAAPSSKSQSRIGPELFLFGAPETIKERLEAFTEGGITTAVLAPLKLVRPPA